MFACASHGKAVYEQLVHSLAPRSGREHSLRQAQRAASKPGGEAAIPTKDPPAKKIKIFSKGSQPPADTPCERKF